MSWEASRRTRRRSTLFENSVKSFQPNEDRDWRGEGVSDCFAPNFSSFGRIKFETCDDMWKFLKAFKGHKFNFNGKTLFHSIDKTTAEMDLSRKVSRALKRLRVCLIEKGLMQERKSNERLSTDSWWPTGTLELRDTRKMTVLFIGCSSWTEDLVF